MNESIDDSKDIEKYLLELQSRSLPAVAIESGLVLLVNVISLIGNTIICWVMFKRPLLHTITNMYILSLAITDVFMALTVMPFSFGVLVTSRWPFGSVVCNIQGSVVLILAFVSSSTVALMALNRYFRIVRPQSYRNWFTVNKSTCMIASVWGMVIVMVILPVVSGWASFRFYPQRSSCFMTFSSQNANKIFTALHLVPFVALPMAAIIICYLKILIKVRRHSATVFPSLQNTNGSSTTELTVEEINITRLLLTIVLGFTLCWIPVLVIEFVNTSRAKPGSLSRWVYLLYKYLWYCSAAINPIIYGALNRSFRKEAMRTIHAYR